MISHKRKCIFIHIPKVAGGSIERLITGKGWCGEHRNGLKIQHEPAYSLQDVHSHNWAEYFKFSFVRNPYDLLFSNFIWSNARKSPKNKIRINKVSKMRLTESFEYFINNVEEQVKPAHFLNKKSKAVWGCHQYDWLCDKEGNLAMDFVGRFEGLHNDIRLIKLKLGIPKVVKLKKENKTPKCNKHYKDYYTPEMIDMVKVKFAKDLEYFQYKF